MLTFGTEGWSQSLTHQGWAHHRRVGAVSAACTGSPRAGQKAPGWAFRGVELPQLPTWRVAGIIMTKCTNIKASATGRGYGGGGGVNIHVFGACSTCVRSPTHVLPCSGFQVHEKTTQHRCSGVGTYRK